MNDSKTPNDPQFDGEAMKVPTAPASLSSNSTSLRGHGFGLIIALLCLVLALLLGGLYLWYKATLDRPIVVSDPVRPTAEENNEPESTTAEAQMEAFEAVSSSNELPAIKADVESTSLDSLSTEINAIDAEIEAGAPQS